MWAGVSPEGAAVSAEDDAGLPTGDTEPTAPARAGRPLIDSQAGAGARNPNRRVPWSDSSSGLTLTPQHGGLGTSWQAWASPCPGHLRLSPEAKLPNPSSPAPAEPALPPPPQVTKLEQRVVLGRARGRQPDTTCHVPSAQTLEPRASGGVTTPHPLAGGDVKSCARWAKSWRNLRVTHRRFFNH